MRGLLAGLIGLLLATPACADWQFTKWGMTPEQVVTASKGGVRGATSEEIKRFSPAIGGHGESALVFMPSYSAANLQFQVAFSFDASKKLCGVTMYRTGDEADYDLTNALTNKYGRPVSDGVWLTADDRIVLFLHSITYSPRSSAEGL